MKPAIPHICEGDLPPVVFDRVFQFALDSPGRIDGIADAAR
jgi:hypothetical protein